MLVSNALHSCLGVVVGLLSIASWANFLFPFPFHCNLFSLWERRAASADRGRLFMRRYLYEGQHERMHESAHAHVRSGWENTDFRSRVVLCYLQYCVYQLLELWLCRILFSNAMKPFLQQGKKQDSKGGVNPGFAVCVYVCTYVCMYELYCIVLYGSVSAGADSIPRSLLYGVHVNREFSLEKRPLIDVSRGWCRQHGTFRGWYSTI